jgi:hypothetical protein
MEAFDAVLAAGALHAHRSVWDTPFVREKDNVLSASPSPRPSLSRPSARRAGDWGWRKEAH